MRFYSFDEIRAKANCIEIAQHLYGCTVNSHGQCAALWRGGDNPKAAHIEHDKWYDHVEKVGGGVIELVAFKYGGNKQEAQQWLGDYLKLTPKTQTVAHSPDNSRYSELIQQGYKETRRWEYRDLDNHVIHFAVRLDHTSKPKEFIQGTPKGWGLGNVQTILYNLAAVTRSDIVYITEGEKCADAVIALGLCATTCAGGAKKWRREFAEHFKGKQAIILPDNDEPGREHALVIAKSLHGIASSVKIVPTSKAEKGDVYDWLDDGHTADELQALVSASSPITAADLEDIPNADTVEIAAAKQANTIPLRNYAPVQKATVRRGREATDEVKEPRHINDLISDVHTRFLGFPRKVGEQLFDHDRETNGIRYISRVADLFAWMGIKSKQQIDWSRGETMVPKEELLSGLHAAARRYEAISNVPDWPVRNDVYYTHTTMPPPSRKNEKFNTLMEMFSPATPEHGIMLRALFTSPLWFQPNIPRPLWIVDSEDGAGTGKSTLVEIVAYLYGGGAPVRTNPQELKNGVEELKKRLISSEGRKARVLLVDNVTGRFACPDLADFVTQSTITGRPPYGRDEENRPNNLTYVITANSASVDNDLASRAYFVFVKRPAPSPNWKNKIIAYINAHRMQIIADIIDILESHTPFPDITPSTRFPEFESGILQAHCKDIGQYSAVIKTIGESSVESNVENEQARDLEETFRGKLVSLDLNPESQRVFIHSNVVDAWVSSTLERNQIIGSGTQHVRNFSKQRLLPYINPKIKAYPHHGENKRKGIMWENPHMEAKSTVWRVYRDHDGAVVKTMF
jgi:hypothetical protein